MQRKFLILFLLVCFLFSGCNNNKEIEYSELTDTINTPNDETIVVNENREIPGIKVDLDDDYIDPRTLETEDEQNIVINNVSLSDNSIASAGEARVMSGHIASLIDIVRANNVSRSDAHYSEQSKHISSDNTPPDYVEIDTNVDTVMSSVSDNAEYSSDNIHDTTDKVIMDRLLAKDFKMMSDDEVIDLVSPLFVEDYKNTGILASVSLAQFIIESGFGKEELAENANNMFGMKTDLSGNTWSNTFWDGISTYSKMTNEHYAGSDHSVMGEFRAYPCVQDSIHDHSSYLLGATKDNELRYKNIDKCRDYKEAAHIIASGGYGTDGSYERKIISKIEELNLTRFDEGVFPDQQDDVITDINSGNGRLIVIDPGHQRKGDNSKEPVGPGSSEMKAKVTGGTIGVSTGLHEYELTLSVAKLLNDELVSRGYKVILCRDSSDVNISNVERAKIANDNKADAFIRLHANGSDDPGKHGIMTICQTAGNPYNPKLYDSSRRLASSILNQTIKATGASKDRLWETDTMTGINWSEVPVTILEMGYMTNPDEDVKMADVNYQKEMVSGIADGIDMFFSY